MTTEAEIVIRKQQHITLAMNVSSQMQLKVFDRYRLPYAALPELDLAEVSTETYLVGKKLKQPLIIASMTGGSTHARTINTHLAQAAEKEGVALGVGSQRVGLEVADARESFEVVRKHAPNAVIFANMGAVQLNYGRGISDFESVVKMVDADALYLHLNPLQEALQPGGDTNFSGLIKKIEGLVKKLSVPVFIKEVGHGLSAEVCTQLLDVGVTGVDVAGIGGTSWAGIEAMRAEEEELLAWFKTFGWPTDRLLQEVAKIKGERLLVASGGVRSPIDGMKAHILGADYYSAAQPFLGPALESAEAVCRLVQTWERGLRIAMFAIGAKDWQSAARVQMQKEE